MLTRNYYKKQACVFTGLKLALVDSDGNTQYTYESKSDIHVPMQTMYVSSLTTAVAENSVVLGTGTTTPSLDDYSLSGDIITTVEPVSDTYINTEMDDGIKTVRTLIVKNIGTEDITIGEIGWFSMVYCNGSTSGSIYRYPFLFDRSVLPTPLTIPAGKTGQVDYVITTKFVTS